MDYKLILEQLEEALKDADTLEDGFDESKKSIKKLVWKISTFQTHISRCTVLLHSIKRLPTKSKTFFCQNLRSWKVSIKG